MDSTPSIEELAKAVADLAGMDDIDRAIAARKLGRSLPTHLGAIADAAVHAATRVDTPANVAARLGLGKKQVERSVWLHNKRSGTPGRPGRTR